MNWFYKITGGRPMAILDRCHFMDMVTGRPVCLCKDKFGRMWMANGQWSLFRVKTNVK